MLMEGCRASASRKLDVPDRIAPTIKKSTRFTNDSYEMPAGAELLIINSSAPTEIGELSGAFTEAIQFSSHDHHGWAPTKCGQFVAQTRNADQRKVARSPLIQSSMTLPMSKATAPNSRARPTKI